MINEYLVVEVVEDCADDGREDDDEEAGTAGLFPVCLVHSGLVVSWVALVERQE